MKKKKKKDWLTYINMKKKKKKDIYIKKKDSLILI